MKCDFIIFYYTWIYTADRPITTKCTLHFQIRLLNGLHTRNDGFVLYIAFPSLTRHFSPYSMSPWRLLSDFVICRFDTRDFLLWHFVIFVSSLLPPNKQYSAPQVGGSVVLLSLFNIFSLCKFNVSRNFNLYLTCLAKFSSRVDSVQT